MTPSEHKPQNDRHKEQRGFLGQRVWLNGRWIVFLTGNGFSLSVWAFGQWNRVQVSRG